MRESPKLHEVMAVIAWGQPGSAGAIDMERLNHLGKVIGDSLQFIGAPRAVAPPGMSGERECGVCWYNPQALPTAGDVELASHFSPAQEFDGQAAVVATAREALALLRTPPVPEPPAVQSRRELIDTLRGRARTTP